jgi:hypothetical protein
MFRLPVGEGEAMRDTIDMARKAGFNLEQGFLLRVTGIDEDLKRFEALVRADEREQGQKWFDAVTAQHKQLILAEREACAKVADYYSMHDQDTPADIAEAIRNRGRT